MSSSINELLADATKRTVHIAIFGRPGVGKSTIGNFILKNHHKGPFKISSGTDACTRVPKTKICDNVSFTDFPGLPDTKPKLTEFCYNMCIDELKCRKYSVLLFVFPKGRTEVDVYKRAGILFREINKVECTKILIINDKNAAFDDPSPNYDNEISNLAGEISACTNIRFNKTISMTKDTMKEKIEDLMATIKSYRRRPVMSPQLRNFDELVLWVDELRKNKEFLAAVHKEKTEEKERLQGELRMYRGLETGIVIAGAGAAVATGAAVAVGALAAEAAAAAATPALACGAGGTATFGGLHFISNSLDERIKKIEEELDRGEFDSAAEELEKETLEFTKLRDALDAQEQEEEEEEEEEEKEKEEEEEKKKK